MKKTLPTFKEAQRIVQEKGIKSARDYFSSYKELGLPSTPNLYYKDKGWIDWIDFLGDKGHPTFKEVRRIVQEKGIKSAKDYFSSYKELGLPAAPHLYYKDKGWTDWVDFLGKTGFPTYKEAKRIVQRKGIKSSIEYNTSFKELGLPASPNKYYKDKGWIDWDIFLGKGFPTYKEAQKIVQRKGIKSSTVYNTSYKELGLPASPHKCYKDNGWIDWDNFLGKVKH